MATEEKLDPFLAGLKPPLRREIERTNPPVATFNEATAIAERLDATDRRLRTYTTSETVKHKTDYDAADYSADFNHWSHDGDGAGPMDVDAAPTLAMITDLTPQEREHCREHSLCFRCRKPNHRAADCTEFKTKKP